MSSAARNALNKKQINALSDAVWDQVKSSFSAKQQSWYHDSDETSPDHDDDNDGDDHSGNDNDNDGDE